VLNFIHLRRRFKEVIREIKRVSKCELYREKVRYAREVKEIKDKTKDHEYLEERHYIVSVCNKSWEMQSTISNIENISNATPFK
jgi:uncharacterized membrane protein YgaE (UPF0421/DUF939 family)